MAPVKVLITGVSGLVGSAAYLHLSQWPERYELYGLGRRRELSERVFDERRIDLPEDRFFICDIADMEGVAAAVEGMDAVVHMAADPSGPEWDSLLRNNIIGAYNVFEASLQAGVGRVIAKQVSCDNRAIDHDAREIGTGRLDPGDQGRAIAAIE